MKSIFLKTLYHLLFWTGVLIFYASILGADNTINTNVLFFSLFLMPVTMGTTYVSIYNLIPRYLIKKRYLRFVFYGISTFIISVFSIFLSVFFGLAYLTDFLLQEVTAISRNGLFIIVCVYLVVIVVSAFKLLKLNLDQERQNKNLQTKFFQSEIQLKEQELNYLKMQIHPHFLFNTLNTIYGFALKKDELAPEMILRLSSLLDYLLYQVNKPFVSLKEELDHIDDYINLEKLRFNETLQVKFIKHIESDNLEIAPMLLIPFVENSFKHGSILDGKLEIEIIVSASSKALSFSVKNSSINDSNKTKGIGLENIKKRLEHIYLGQYSLDISTSERCYKIDLQIQFK